MKITTTQLRRAFFFMAFFLFFSAPVFSQGASKDFKNSVKFNVTNTLLYDNSYQFSYERIIKENQSLNVFVGYQEFPLITVDLSDDASFSKNSSRDGFSVGADYRFYLGSINKFKGPRGVYLAPFVSFFQFGTDRDINYTDSNNTVNTVNLSSKFNLTNIGGELGYQFVLWDRFVVDCVLFGPSLTHYKFNAKLDGSIPGIEDNEVYQKVIQAIKDKFPGIEGVTGDEGIEKKGVQSITAVGFRYNISIGYRF
ncbi:hypothetical protein [Flavobacterium taihuense]|uniref:DUF3575 domain-containing protein n=1 Tax=Flavobacterium taihuense TaxID=2857508 RepID=A0ABS6Y0S1_9FLAO|nr:hypothetical protein [Flavobacterium taihuense]MBW4362532.1 hypothetical protein [Flavobacterium taihuense]